MAFPSWSLGTRRKLELGHVPTLDSGTGFQPVVFHGPEGGGSQQGAPPLPPALGRHWFNPAVAPFFSLAKAGVLSYSRR